MTLLIYNNKVIFTECTVNDLMCNYCPFSLVLNRVGKSLMLRHFVCYFFCDLKITSTAKMKCFFYIVVVFIFAWDPNPILHCSVRARSGRSLFLVLYKKKCALKTSCT